MSNLLTPSEVLRAIQHKWRDELAKVRGQKPLWRCYDCKRTIPRDELPMRCGTCSGPDIVTGVYPRRRIKQDAMVCKNCVDKHDHLKAQLLDFQMQVYESQKDKHAESVVN